jgi:nitrogen fixation/metabolism regulation signal transduction histidine kinase
MKSTTFWIFAPGVSLRRRVAVSLAIVRLILAPVILLAIYYLFQMGWIVDRIVSVDAPSATLAQQASIQMFEARRAERNYFLLYDPAEIKENRDSLAAVSGILSQIRSLHPEEETTVQDALDAVNLYQRRFEEAVAYFSQPGEAQRGRLETVVRNYESDLNTLVRRNNRTSMAKLVDQLRAQVDSFDTQIMSTIQASDPKLRQVVSDLDATSHELFALTSTLEGENWQRVQGDHERAQQLLHRAEWVLSIVSAVTILLSLWVSLVLPRQVIKPLMILKDAVDQAITGEYQVQFELKGKGEVVELAKSIRSLIAHFHAGGQTA